MIAATILPLVAADGDPQRAVALASLLAVMVASIMIVAGLTGLGFVADLLSKPTMIGYMNGLAVTIVVGQLPKLFGFSVDADGLIAEAAGFVRGLADGKAVPAAAVLGIAGIVVVLGLQRWLPKVPAVLVLVVLAIAATSVFDLAARGVSLVGVLPQGFPPFTLPTAELSDLGPARRGGARHRPGVTGRHHLDVVLVRRPHRPGGRRGPGDDRDRRGEPGGRALPGLPRQHERVADGGRRAGGRAQPAHRRSSARRSSS